MFLWYQDKEERRHPHGAERRFFMSPLRRGRGAAMTAQSFGPASASPLLLRRRRPGLPAGPNGERPSLSSPSYNYLSVDACAPLVAQGLRCRASKDKRNRTKIIQHRRPPSVEVMRLALSGLPFLIGRRQLRRPALRLVLSGRPPCLAAGGVPSAGLARLGWRPRRASSRRWPMCGGLPAA